MNAPWDKYCDYRCALRPPSASLEMSSAPDSSAEIVHVISSVYVPRFFLSFALLVLTRRFSLCSITQSRISIAAASAYSLEPKICPNITLTLCQVVFAYEYVITFDQEVSLFWMRKKTGATWLFLLIRYMALVSVCILNTATYIPMSDEVRK